MPLTIAGDAAAVDRAKLPFQEQIDFFRGKLGRYVPTERFDDIATEAHETAFAVANAQAADLLADFYEAVSEAISEGQSIDWFRKEFDRIQAKYGWVHTGSSSWRTRTIYETNMLTSYARGRDAQLADPELRAARPYLEYRIGPAENHRPLHVSWNGLTLPADDPWWDSHRPVKAWGCHCWVRAVAEPTPGKSTRPNNGAYEYTDRHGEIHTIPAGVDYGFHRSGWQPDPRDYPAQIGADLSRALARGG